MNRINLIEVATYNFLGMQTPFFTEGVDYPRGFVAQTFSLRNLHAQPNRLCYKGGNLR